MIPWSGIPFVRFTLAFISGILFYLFLFPKEGFLLPAIIALLCYIILFLWQKFRRQDFYFLKPLLGLSALCALFFLGALFTEQKDEQNQPAHILHTGRSDLYEAILASVPEGKERTWKAEARVIKIFTDTKWKPAEGNIILYLSRKDYVPLRYGDKIVVRGMPAPVKGPVNPGEFDYRSYLRYHHIYHTHYLQAGDYRLVSSGHGVLLLDLAFRLRSAAQAIIERYVPGKTEQGITMALLLGLKTSMDPDTRDIYSGTGTAHILVVSGLHVAIVFQIFIVLFFFLKFTQAKKWILPALLLAVLWLYILVTGFCPSVLRAGVVFSILIIRQAIHKHANVYNTLFFSAFVLLCYDPFMIMDTGFQLSYLAVLGIVSFTDTIYEKLEINNRILDNIWLSTSMSLAAQVTTLPLTVYCFHQFPLSFLISNLIAINISFVLIWAGTFMLCLSFIPVLAHVLGLLISWLIGLMNHLLLLLLKLPFTSLKNLYLDLPQTWLIYLTIGTMVAFLHYKKLFYLRISLLLLLVVSGISVYRTIITGNQNRFVVFNLKNETVMAFIRGEQAFLIADKLTEDSETYQSLAPGFLGMGIREVYINPANMPVKRFVESNFSLFTYQNKSFLWIKNKRLGIKEFPNTDYIITPHLPSDYDSLSAQIILLKNTRRRSSSQASQIYDMNVKPAFITDL